MKKFMLAMLMSDLPVGSMKKVQFGNEHIALANVNGSVFAVSDFCTHEECSLSGEGFLEGTTILCGCHGASFDVTNGNVLSLPATVNLKKYEVKVENGSIFVALV